MVGAIFKVSYFCFEKYLWAHIFIGLQYHVLISVVDCVYILYTAAYLEF